MSDPIVLPSELQTALNERADFWADVGHAKGTANDVLSVANQIPAGDSGTSVRQLVDTANPPAEIAAVLSALRNEVTTIGRLDTDIRDTESKIAQLQQQQLMMRIAGVVGGIMVFLFLLAQFTPIL